MRPSEVLKSHRDTIRESAARHPSRIERLFGCTVCGDDFGHSDLDLLVDPLPRFTLLDFWSMPVELKQTLGLLVDLLTAGDLPVTAREGVCRAAVAVRS